MAGWGTGHLRVPLLQMDAPPPPAQPPAPAQGRHGLGAAQAEQKLVELLAIRTPAGVILNPEGQAAAGQGTGQGRQGLRAEACGLLCPHDGQGLPRQLIQQVAFLGQLLGAGRHVGHSGAVYLLQFGQNPAPNAVAGQTLVFIAGIGPDGQLQRLAALEGVLPGKVEQGAGKLEAGRQLALGAEAPETATATAAAQVEQEGLGPIRSGVTRHKLTTAQVTAQGAGAVIAPLARRCFAGKPAGGHLQVTGESPCGAERLHMGSIGGAVGSPAVIPVEHLQRPVVETLQVLQQAQQTEGVLPPGHRHQEGRSRRQQLGRRQKRPVQPVVPAAPGGGWSLWPRGIRCGGTSMAHGERPVCKRNP